MELSQKEIDNLIERILKKDWKKFGFEITKIEHYNKDKYKFSFKTTVWRRNLTPVDDKLYKNPNFDSSIRGVILCYDVITEWFVKSHYQLLFREDNTRSPGYNNSYLIPSIYFFIFYKSI